MSSTEASGATSPRSLSWSFLDGWRTQVRRVSWHDAEPLAEAFETLAKASEGRLIEEMVRWDERLSDIGGEPGFKDWTHFRPLRLSREEDWSDWLAFLLEGATGVELARHLLGADGDLDAGLLTGLRVKREVVAGAYRADLVLEFRDESWAHIEVKVGDLALEKTLGTGDALRRDRHTPCLGDFLLLPPRDVARWDEQSVSPSGQGPDVRVRTWLDVARGLRAALRVSGAEKVSWRVWAATFLGAIEQRILGFPRLSPGAGAHRFAAYGAVARLEYLTRENER